MHAPYAFGDFLIAETKGQSQPLPPAYASHSPSVANDARSHSNCRELWHSIAARCQGSKTSCKLLCAAMRKPNNETKRSWMNAVVGPLTFAIMATSCLVQTMQSCNAVSPSCIKRQWKIGASIIQSKCCVTSSIIHLSKVIEPLPASSTCAPCL